MQAVFGPTVPIYTDQEPPGTGFPFIRIHTLGSPTQTLGGDGLTLEVSTILISVYVSTNESDAESLGRLVRDLLVKGPAPVMDASGTCLAILDAERPRVGIDPDKSTMQDVVYASNATYHVFITR